MATNDMYRQLLSQAVHRDGSALIGGAMIGGYFPKKPVERKSNRIDPAIRAQRMQTGVPATDTSRGMSAEQYSKLFSDAAINKATANRKARQAYIDDKLIAKYGGRTKIPYAERALTIAQARIDLHLAKEKKKLSPEQKQKAEISTLKRLAKKYPGNL